MARGKSHTLFVVLNLVVWLLMTAILVVVPDRLEPAMGLALARVIGWVVACGVWVIVVEHQWRARFGVLVRFAGQLVLWVTAVVLASWISEQARVW